MSETPDQPLSDDDIVGDSTGSDAIPASEQDADGVDHGQDAEHDGGGDLEEPEVRRSVGPTAGWMRCAHATVIEPRGVTHPIASRTSRSNSSW